MTNTINSTQYTVKLLPESIQHIFIYSQFSKQFLHCVNILFATKSIKVNYMKVINMKEKYEAAVHVTQHLIDSVKVGLSARAKQHPLSNLYYQSSAIVIVIMRGFLTNDVFYTS